MGPPLFTVFTPTYERAHTLHRVRDSLAAQTFRSFEWVVVDDGSTDGTRERLHAWASDPPFPMTVLRQDNAGKHVAINRGVAAARGELFLIHDSDDACVPHALERFAELWRGIPEERRQRYTGVTAACRDDRGRPVGDPLPTPVLDATALELRYRHRVRGERWGFVRTELLRRFPFPEEPRRTYVPESLVWDRLALDHTTRFVADELRIYHIDPATESIAHGGNPARNAIGSFLQYGEVLDEQLGWFREAPADLWLAAAHFVRFGLHAGRDLGQQWRRLRGPGARALWLAAVPAGAAAWIRDRGRR